MSTPSDAVASGPIEASPAILVALRREAGLTQRDVASRMNRTQSAIAKLEARKGWRWDEIESYAAALGLTPKVVITGVGKGGGA